MKANQALIRVLEELGVTYIFGYPGGANLPIYDALYSSKKIEHILAMHEQGAALMADGYARVKQTVGVCLATSGPGVTNLLTGLANAYLDSVPLVALTGQIPMKFIGTDAFQEVDTMNISLSVTKHNEFITNSKELVSAVREAFYIANTGRKGPVLLDFPRDILSEEVSYDFKKRELLGYKPTLKTHIGQIKRCHKILSQAKKPLILVGGGVERAQAIGLVKKFAEATNIPCVRTLMGKNSFHEEHPLFIGMIGTHGSAAGNKAISQADIILALGSRFGDRSTLMKKEKFAKQAEIIHVDIDPAEIGKIIPVKTPIVGDIHYFLTTMLDMQKENHWKKPNWIVKKPSKNMLAKEDDAELVGKILEQLSQIPKKLHITTDVGRHQLWAIHKCQNPLHAPLLTSGGLGAMGYGLPAAIGAWFAEPKIPVVNVSGDGSFFMNMQEFLVAVEYDIPLTIMIINDAKLSMIRELQTSVYQKRYIGYRLRSQEIDFVQLANSLGGQGYRVEKMSEVAACLQEAIQKKKPTIIDFNMKLIAKNYD